MCLLSKTGQRGYRSQGPVAWIYFKKRKYSEEQQTEKVLGKKGLDAEKRGMMGGFTSPADRESNYGLQDESTSLSMSQLCL